MDKTNYRIISYYFANFYGIKKINNIFWRRKNLRRRKKLGIWRRLFVLQIRTKMVNWAWMSGLMYSIERDILLRGNKDTNRKIRTTFFTLGFLLLNYGWLFSHTVQNEIHYIKHCKKLDFTTPLFDAAYIENSYYVFLSF